MPSTRTPSRSRALRRTTRLGLAFTLVELLVAITIIVLVSAALLPAFARIIESNNYSSAVNTVSAALGNARSTAIQTGRRAGVVFLWDAQREVTTLLLVSAGASELGVLSNQAPDCDGRSRSYCEIVKPTIASAPIELPRGIGVFGLSLAVDTTDQWDCRVQSSPEMYQWYAGEVVNVDNNDPDDDVRLWLFPRNDPRLFTPAANATDTLGRDPWQRLRAGTSNDEDVAALRSVCTFFVQFSPDGAIVSSARSGGDNIFDSYVEFPDEPIDPQSTATPIRPYDDPARFDPENVRGVPGDPARRQRNPEVVLRGAEQLAVVDLDRMNKAVGLRRAWLVRAETSRPDNFPAWLDGSEGERIDYVDDDQARKVSRWIDNNAEIISFNRYSGNAVRRSAS